MTSEKHLPPLSNAETSAFCSQMAMILRSGISSIEGISILLEDSTDSGETELLQQINQTLLETGRLRSGFGCHRRFSVLHGTDDPSR